MSAKKKTVKKKQAARKSIKKKQVTAKIAKKKRAAAKTVKEKQVAARKVKEEEDAELYSLGIAFNGTDIVSILDARIPIYDMGFLHSDVTYDVVSVWKGSFFRLKEHMDRFERSYQGLGFKMPYTKEQMRQILIDMVARAKLKDAYVFMCATRGLPDMEDPRNMDKYTQMFYAFAVPFIWLVDPEEQLVGTDVIISSVPRIPKECVDPTIKNHHWGDLTRADKEAHAKGAKTAFLLDHDGNLTEGVGFNVWIIKDGELRTPDSGCLLGITRLTVFDLAKEMNIPAKACKIPAQAVREADEIFMCTTAGGIMPVKSVDDIPISGGKPGSITMRLHEAFWKAHDRPEYSTPVNYD
ncbi:MAG: branched-chain amino acid transferase [Candidatus Abyssobacteria bacterium SURF_17]|uniref:branched-chain-amino-acid transaminase n=1 Tax=Candidatus Abyssobacteria bacterium SURF_17 TaxID=2093361 RepID=A0A419EXL1_9BACT|nr:MAG: branched-chain amino acid transferase [Candidatus Abyssubacteria bacterium SURF_17]